MRFAKGPPLEDDVGTPMAPYTPKRSLLAMKLRRQFTVHDALGEVRHDGVGQLAWAPFEDVCAPVGRGGDAPCECGCGNGSGGR